MEDSLDSQISKSWGDYLDGGWALLPVVAVIGGAWAFAVPLHNGRWTELAAALALVLGGWCPLWRALTHTDWATPISRWRTWDRNEALPRWPYLQPGTPGAALHHTLALARSWWQAVGQAALTAPVRSAALSLLVSVLIGVILGRAALLLTLLLASWAEMAVLWHAGRGRAGTGWAAVALVGAPWLLGASLAEVEMALPFLSAFVLTLLMGLYAAPSPLAAGGPLLAASFLIWSGHFVAAGALMLLALPGLMLLLHRPDTQEYRQAVTPWLLAMLLLVAWVL